MHRRRLSVLLMASLFATAPAFAVASHSATTRQNRTIQTLPPVEVTAGAPESLTTPSTQTARQTLDKVPGNTSLVTDDQIQSHATGNLEDTLRFVPGVYAKGKAGPESRLSIRGSNISIPWVIKGTTILRNGIPLNEADGWYHSQLIEPLTYQYVEVYPGANGLKYGASNIGGAINLVPYTGYTAAPYSASIETGTRGYLHPQVSSAGLLNHGWDYYASLSGLYSNGWRKQQDETNSTMFYANLGHRHGDAETRIHLDLALSKQELPGALTPAQLRNDPRTVNDGTTPCFGPPCPANVIPFSPVASSVNADKQNKFQRYRLAVQHSLAYGEDNRNTIQAAFFIAHQHVHHPLLFVHLEKRYENYGTSVRGLNHFTLFGRDNRLIWGGVAQFENSRFKNYDPKPGGHEGPIQNSNNANALTAQVYFENHFPLLPSLDLVIGSQFAYAIRRDRGVDHTATPATPFTRDEDYYGANPKLGLVWTAAKGVQIFGNVSRSFQPPVLFAFNNPARPGTLLDAETATTVEVGTRGHRGLWRWQLALYHAWVRHEILSSGVSTATQFRNAGTTHHAGVELGLDGRIPLNLFGDDDLHLRMAFTYSRFRFDGDTTGLHSNRLPGTPNAFGRVGLFYEHGKYYIGPTLESSSSYYADYTNTQRVGAYLIYGAKAGYRTQGWDVYVEGLNLGNKHYAASSEIDTSLTPNDHFLDPGRPRTVMVGIRHRW